MATYDKKSLLNNRYQLLATSSIYTYDDDNLTSYAEFLRFEYKRISIEFIINSPNFVFKK